jgi:hypothetical protein
MLLPWSSPPAQKSLWGNFSLCPLLIPMEEKSPFSELRPGQSPRNSHWWMQINIPKWNNGCVMFLFYWARIIIFIYFSLPLVSSQSHKLQFHYQFLVACIAHSIIRIWVIGILRLCLDWWNEVEWNGMRLSSIVWIF